MAARWTPEDDEAIRALYPSLDLADLCARLGRSQSAVHQRAWALNVRRPHPGDWTAAEWAYLESTWATTPTRDVVKHLGRPYESVRMAASRMGLKKVRRFSRDEVDSTRYHGAPALKIADLMYADTSDLMRARKRAVFARYRALRPRLEHPAHPR
jgi:hypothetical protein